MELSQLDHVNIQTARLDETVHFFQTVLGLRLGSRPAFPFPGAWLYLGDQAVIHLIGLPPGDPAAVTGSGAVNHLAFMGSDCQEFLARISTAGMAHDVRDVPGLDQRQVFLKDPNGVTVEISFQGEIARSGGERLEPLRLTPAG
jgi:catechol 2,3-dioxygenase-like lactoylglutathione lyase family enzyme